jgi:hypothetical protein
VHEDIADQGELAFLGVELRALSQTNKAAHRKKISPAAANQRT